MYIIQRMRTSWIGHTLRMDCLPTHIIEGKIERGAKVTER